MSIRILENEHLRAAVSDAGAELISVFDRDRQAERIWTGEAEIWNRHAPILFPFVGRVMDGKYRIGGREYAMKTQHGFARDREFTCTEASAGAAVHRLTADEETLRIYPYAFGLTVRHSLEGRRLRIQWTVENAGSGRMYFSIGGHPGFLLPEGVCKEDCSILFPGAKALRYLSVSPAGYALPGLKELPLESGRAPYREDIPDTWIFEDGQVEQVGIAGPDGEPLVMMRLERFPMLAVWANPKGPFICLEPWFGRTDDEGFSGTMDRKKGIQVLESGESRDMEYTIDFC